MMNEYISEMVAREDKSTAEHSGRVAKIADILGMALSLSKSELLTLGEAAKLHGKTELDAAGFIRADENDKRAPA